MSRGRPAQRIALADKVEGSEQAKARLKVLLQTLSGELSVIDACQQLGLSEARFHELRQEWLRTACAALEPKPAGRPKEQTPEAEAELRRLQQENQNLKLHLRAAQIREEIALVMPQLLLPKQAPEPDKDAKKKTP